MTFRYSTRPLRCFWRQRKDRMSSLDLRSMGEQRRYRRVEAGPPPPGQAADGTDAPPQDPDEQYDRIDLTRDVQRARGASREGLRRVHAGRGAGSPTAAGLSRVESWVEAHTPPGARQGVEAGRASHTEIQRAVRWRAPVSEDPPSEGEGSTTGCHLRCERLHGAVHADAAALHPQPVCGPGKPGGVVPLRNQANPRHQAAGKAGT